MWLFGYGSLVSRASFEHTLGRRLGDDFHEVDVEGYQRRWEFSIRDVPTTAVLAPPSPGRAPTDRWTITVLGLVEAPSCTVNGVVGRVTSDELAAFDRRERTYRRADVTHRTCVDGAPWRSGSVVTYLPTELPRARYRLARAGGTAVVDARYRQLVDDAFGRLGPEQHRRYHASTAVPQVPIVTLSDEHVPGSHLVADR